VKPGTTVAEALDQARSRGVALLDARALLSRLFNADRAWLIAHDDAVLAPDIATRWSSWLDRRSNGEPLAYLLGEKEFFGLMLEVTPDVLVPRPETELLVEWAGELIGRTQDKRHVIDLGTGSGAIALAIKNAHRSAQVSATDCSEAALGVARRNSIRLGLDIDYIRTSWWQGLGERHFDIAIANPPYVRSDDPALDLLAHEPRAALTPGASGREALTAIIDAAASHLALRGWLIVEHGFEQAEAVRALFESAGFKSIETRRDLTGHPRATGGQRPSEPS